MPRRARKRANSGIYHVMLRGIDRQEIFRDREDCLRFLKILKDCRELCGFELYAYCLMGNHVHLLLKDCNNDLETIFKRIGGKYVYWFNAKYERVGHLFQDRFRSEPVEDDAYFLTVLRYIHQNPVKAKLCAYPGDYPDSSYRDYLDDGGFVDTQFALGMMSREEFIRFHNQVSNDQCLELTPPARRAMTDGQAQQWIEKLTHCRTIAELQALDEETMIRIAQKLNEKGVSIRQLSRLTGYGKTVIERWLRT